MSLIEIKSVTITEKGQIAIPKDIREIEGFEIGSKVAILAFEDHVELRSMKKMSDAMMATLATEQVLAKNWLSKEDEDAWKDL